MRIVSLLPAATEWICEFGGGPNLVGRSHECDYPSAVQDVPVVTEATYDADGDSVTINDAVQSNLQEGLSLYTVDLERIAELDPDLIVTQDQCEVCAVSLTDLESELQNVTGGDLDVVSLRPQTLKEVLDEALRLGRAVSRLEAAMQVIGNFETGLRSLREQVGVDERPASSRPTVACIEWLEPLMIAGHWMPDVVEMLGGRAVLGTAGEPTRTVDWADLVEADPDVLAIMPCGFTIEETLRDMAYLTDREGWASLSAVQAERVFVFDGNAYFNRPGPRLYRALETLATALYPNDVRIQPSPAPWERQRLTDIGVQAP